MPRSRRAIVYRERDIPGRDTESECLEIEVSVGPVERDPWCYGSRENEIITIRDANGERPDLIDALSEAEVDSIYCEAIEDVEESDEAAQEDAWERYAECRADAERERYQH